MRSILSIGLCVIVGGVTPGVGAAPIDLSFPVPLATEPLFDLDQDGHLDGVWVTHSSKDDHHFVLHWSRGLGAGLFETAQEREYGPIGYQPVFQLWDATDLTGDGYPEVLVYAPCGACNCAVGSLVVIANGGPSGPGAAEDINVGNLGQVIPRDLDADGDLDLVTSTAIGCTPRLGSVQVFRRGPTQFESPAFYSSEEQETEIALGDWNHDGSPDIAIPFLGSFLPNVGGSVFGLPVAMNASIAAAHFAHARDLDADGRDDLVVATSTGVHVILANAQGTFQDSVYAHTSHAVRAVDLDADLDLDYVLFAETGIVLMQHVDGARFDVLQVPHSLVDSWAAEFNRDGLPDFLQRLGTWFRPILSRGIGVYEIGECHMRRLATTTRAVDFDEDGIEDLVTRTSTGKVEGIRGIGDGTFVAPTCLPLLGGEKGIELAYVDADSSWDAVTSLTAGFAWAAGSGDGEFAPQPGYQWPESALQMRDFVLADFDRDGDLDLAAARGAFSGPGDVAVILNSGGGVFGAPVPYAAGVSPSAIIAGDFDGDDRQDVIVNGWSSFVLLLRGRGDGTFEAPEYIEAGTPGALAAGDVDGDGDLDLLAHVATGTAVHLNQGDGGFTTPTLLGTGPGRAFGPIAVADFDGNGRSDFVVSGSGVVFVHSLTAGGFDIASRAPMDVIQHLTTADFDRDGSIDVALAYAGSSGVRGLQVFQRGSNGQFTPSGVLPETGPSCAAADVTGDGYPDLVAPNALCLNRTAGTSPVAVADFAVEDAGASLLLRWRLAVSGTAARGVRIERAVAAEGPYADLTPHPLPVTASLFEDTAPPPESSVWYRLIVLDAGGPRVAATIVFHRSGPAGRTRIHSVKSETSGVEIRYHVGVASPVLSLEICDVAGRRVASLLRGPHAAGARTLVWDGRGSSGQRVASGVYFVVLRADHVRDARKFVHFVR